MKYLIIPVRMTVQIKNKIIKSGEDVERGKACTQDYRMTIAIRENSIEAPPSIVGGDIISYHVISTLLLLNCFLFDKETSVPMSYLLTHVYFIHSIPLMKAT